MKKVKRMEIHCTKCGRMLGERIGDEYISRKRGRVVISPAGGAVVCENCGTRINMGGQEDYELSDFAKQYPISISSLRQICQTICEFVSYTQLSPEQIDRYFFEDDEHTIPHIIGGAEK